MKVRICGAWGMPGQREREEETFPVIHSGAGSPKLPLLRGTALPAAVPRWDGRARQRNYMSVIRTVCPKQQSRLWTKRAAGHVGNLPDSACLKEMFLLARCRMHGINRRGPSACCGREQRDRGAMGGPRASFSLPSIWGREKRRWVCRGREKK